MTPERSRYFQGITDEEFSNRVMVLYHKSKISGFKKRLTLLNRHGDSEIVAVRLFKALVREEKKRLIEAKSKLPCREVKSS